MHSLLAYLVQVNILLAIIYIGYYTLLRQLTFYRLNRVYFLLGVLFAFSYPFLDIKSIFKRHMEPVGEWMGYLPAFYFEQVESSIFTLENAVYGVIGLVSVCFTLRLGLQFVSLWRVHLHSRKSVWKAYWYQNVVFPIVPFSFLNKIYVHKEQHGELELYDIFEHEDIHVKGLHTLDIVLFEILLIVCWYNPFVWLVRRAVRQNLEYLTDHQVLNKGVDRQTYQYSLLNVSKHGVPLGVSSPFNFKFLRKRIMMMNKKKSSKLELSKYAFLLPIVIFSAGAFTVSKADGKIIKTAEMARDIRWDNWHAPAVVDKIKPDWPTRGGAITVAGYEDSLRVGEIKGDPMVVLNGKVQENGKHALRYLASDDVESIEVIKDSTAVKRYGAQAADGVINVTVIPKKRAAVEVSSFNLKSKSEIDQKEDLLYVYDGEVISKGEFFKLDDSALYDLQQIKGDKPNMEAILLQRYPNNSDFLGKTGWVQAFSKKTHVQQKEVLYMVDGAPQKGKDKSAMERYGEQGKNGVILVKTKDAAEKKVEQEFDTPHVWAPLVPEPLKNPGYVVDGVMVSKEVYVKINENEKKSIVTLPKKEAENYFKFYNKAVDLGEHDGVVMITTK